MSNGGGPESHPTLAKTAYGNLKYKPWAKSSLASRSKRAPSIDYQRCGFQMYREGSGNKTLKRHREDVDARVELTIKNNGATDGADDPRTPFKKRWNLMAAERRREIYREIDGIPWKGDGCRIADGYPRMRILQDH
ncbi:hypothetical protein BY996DRAFT_6613908 [Phakopsora pachyrhizi]|nr:hypothetical protein BY996DRAFT_6613908 [Phakopsora pachyrhizi]